MVPLNILVSEDMRYELGDLVLVYLVPTPIEITTRDQLRDT